MNKIEVRNVVKTFGNTKALDQVSLTLKENKIYGLLGRNGAGKSTLLNVIMNRLFAEEGEILIDGKTSIQNEELGKQIYMMSEQTLFPEGMKITEIFQWTKEFYSSFDLDYAQTLSKLFDLNTKKTVKSLSTGNKSILKIIIALSVNVPFLILDEPVLGLDANNRELFYKTFIEKYAENPFTAIISTHLIEEAAGIIEEVIIIKNGKIILTESKDNLMEKGYSVSGKSTDVDAYTRGKPMIGMDTLGNLKTAYLLGKPEKSELMGSLEIGRMDLQKIYLQLTNS